MKKILFVALMSILLAACSSKVYNSQLKEVQLGMSKTQVEMLMGDKYVEHPAEDSMTGYYEKREYKDRYKNHWFFIFQDDKLVKWYKEKE